MSPLSYALPLLPALAGMAQAGATQVARGGSDFLRLLAGTNEPVAVVDQAATNEPQFEELKQAIGNELRDNGFSSSLPLEVIDDGSGAIRVTSFSFDRGAIESLLNLHPTIAGSFRAAAQSSPIQPFGFTVE